MRFRKNQKLLVAAVFASGLFLSVLIVTRMGFSSEVSVPYLLGDVCILEHKPGNSESAKCVVYKEKRIGPMVLKTAVERPKLMVQFGQWETIGLVDLYIGIWAFLPGMLTVGLLNLEWAARWFFPFFCVGSFFVTWHWSGFFKGGHHPFFRLMVSTLSTFSLAVLLPGIQGYFYEIFPPTIIVVLFISWLSCYKNKRDLPLWFWVLFGIGLATKATSMVFPLTVFGLWWWLGIRPGMAKPWTQFRRAALSVLIGIPFVLVDPWHGDWWRQSALGLTSVLENPKGLDAATLGMRVFYFFTQGFGADDYLPQMFSATTDLAVVGGVMTIFVVGSLLVGICRRGFWTREMKGLMGGVLVFLGFGIWLYPHELPPVQASFPVLPTLAVVMAHAWQGRVVKIGFFLGWGLLILVGFRFLVILESTTNPSWHKSAQVEMAQAIDGENSAIPLVTSSFTQMGLVEAFGRQHRKIHHAYHYFDHTRTEAADARWRSLLRHYPGRTLLLLEGGDNPNICCFADSRKTRMGLTKVLKAENRKYKVIQQIHRNGIMLFEILRLEPSP